ncbi:MAG: response regulator with CheY-like receiver, AAA-type ATPase, and DNA-binding domain [Bacteroidetes bacterium]|jgi:serine phosphatase RsbU (regulator of sigma subunit)|nr:response regulator with CheY-like receiver, AAA-type ATPase, and DNA-binding domain [Bacteroidota bacterium]
MKILRVFGILSLLIIVGFLFKMQWWPGAGPLLILGTFFYIAFYTPLLAIQERKSGEKLIYIIIKSIVCIVVAVSVIFKSMYWPGASVLAFLSAIIWFFVFLPYYIFRQFKINPDKIKRTNNIIHFILITCFVFYLSMGGRNYNFNSFTEIEAGIIVNAKKTERKNGVILQAINSTKNDTLSDSAAKVHAKTTALIKYIRTLRNKLVAACDNITEASADSLENSEIRKTSSVDMVTKMLFGGAGNRDTSYYSAYDLKKQIRSYYFYLLKIPSKSDRPFFEEGLNLNTDDITYTEDDAEYKQTWESFYFENMPLSAILAKFESLKYDILLAENQTLQYLLNSAYSKNTGITAKINELIESQETAERKNEIELLKKEKSEYNSKMIEKNTTVENQSRTLVIIIFVVIAAVCLLIITIYSNNERKKVNIQLAKQKEYIEHQKQEITDSINYSKRIQSAILPLSESIVRVFPQSFILFKPKDIVSGDFYWFAENENGYLIAAADCTGHGVPGAFMSVINSEKLTEASIVSSNVAELLHRTNLGVKKTLRQTESEDSTRDGMDICLCHFDRKLSQVTYAGANRPLWIIRNGSTEITEIKATKAAIGGLTPDDQQFDSNMVKVSPGDTLYLFTDGYADQFSPQDKKLMTRKFKEILLSIQDKTMEEQKQFLGTFIEDWRGDMEQTDDILVIGVRV